ncbi:MAG: DUF1640 domain-containing protein [Magnetococcales bacterium]|nr:DUF1640 domain-containing protein [Magnetococcales bacterium]MBF0113804.1 DUF1640 domain-containing protein [Magnetococcales bacterium]
MELIPKSAAEYTHGAVFDSYAYVRRLRDAGMDEDLAAILSEQFASLIDTRLASKRDVLETEARLKLDIAAIDAKVETTKASLQRDVLETEARLKLDIAAIDAKVETTKASLQKEVEATRVNLQKELEATRVSLQKDLETTRVSLQKEIESTKASLQKDIEVTKASLQKEIEKAKVETVKWVVATGIVILGGMATINRIAPPVPIYLQAPAQELRLPAPLSPAR